MCENCPQVYMMQVIFSGNQAQASAGGFRLTPLLLDVGTMYSACFVTCLCIVFLLAADAVTHNGLQHDQSACRIRMRWICRYHCGMHVWYTKTGKLFYIA